jgi:hypothetical protein
LAFVCGDKDSQGVGKLLSGTRVTTGIKHTLIDGKAHDVELVSLEVPGVLRPQIEPVVAGEKEILAICRNAVNVFQLTQAHAFFGLRGTPGQQQCAQRDDRDGTTHHSEP